MADNFDFTPGTGKTGSADDVGGVLYPRVKLDLGTDGAAAPALAGAGAVATGVQRITLASDDPAVVDLAAMEALLITIDSDTNAIKNAVEILDDWDDGDLCNVNLNIAGTDVTGGAGAVGATTQRITLASDDPAVVDLAAIEALLITIDSDTNDIKTAVEILDDWDDSDFCNVNCNIAGTDLVGGAGAVAAGVQRVTLASDDPAVVDLAAIEALLITIDSDTNDIKTAVEILDDWDDGDLCNVNLNIAGTDVTGGAGAVGATTQRVTLASDDPAVVDLAAIEALLITIDSDTNDIKTAVEILDDWDDSDFCNVNLNLAGTDAGVGESALDGTELRVTVATDDDLVAHLATIAGDTTNIETAVQLLDNAVYVDDADWTDDTSSHLLVGGVYQSAPHTVTDGDVSPFQLDVGGHLIEANSADILTALQVIDDWDDSDFCNVNLNIEGSDVTADEGVIDAQTLRVTIATDDDGVAHLATIAGDTTAAQTALEIIDDWDTTHDSAASADGPQMMAAYDATKPTAVADGDAVRVLADEYGRLLPGVEKTAWQEDYNSADASGEGETVKASAASTILVVQSYIISADTEMWVKLQEEDSSALTGQFWLKAGGGVAITLPENAPLVLGVDSDLEVITEGAGDMSVTATGYTIPG